MRATEFEVRVTRFVILELPSISFTSGVILPAIPQRKEDLALGREDLLAGRAGGIYEEVGREEVREAVRVGLLYSPRGVVPVGKPGAFFFPYQGRARVGCPESYAKELR
jgi:hypothetical protein